MPDAMADVQVLPSSSAVRSPPVTGRDAVGDLLDRPPFLERADHDEQADEEESVDHSIPGERVLDFW
jgi:hypothetical protein